MNLGLTATSSGSYQPPCQEPVALSLDISAILDSETYDGTANLKGGDIKVTNELGDSVTVPVISGAPPIAVAIDLLKCLSDNRHTMPKVFDTGVALHKYDLG